MGISVVCKAEYTKQYKRYTTSTIFALKTESNEIIFAASFKDKQRINNFNVR